jgi:hypothetical protein
MKKVLLTILVVGISTAVSATLLSAQDQPDPSKKESKKKKGGKKNKKKEGNDTKNSQKN